EGALTDYLQAQEASSSAGGRSKRTARLDDTRWREDGKNICRRAHVVTDTQTTRRCHQRGEELRRSQHGARPSSDLPCGRRWPWWRSALEVRSKTWRTHTPQLARTHTELAR
ncbi:UPF0234 protein, partial [Frankliniella fusca]